MLERQLLRRLGPRKLFSSKSKTSGQVFPACPKSALWAVVY